MADRRSRARSAPIAPRRCLLAAEAPKHEEKREENEQEPKEEKEKKAKKPRAPKKKGTSLDAPEPQSELVKDDYEGELELLEEVEHDDGNIYYINDDKVYDAEKKCVGKVEKGKVNLF